MTTDQTDKPAEYATAGIEHFWRLETGDGAELTVFRHRLDPTTRVYASAGAESATLVATEPFGVTVALADLR